MLAEESAMVRAALAYGTGPEPGPGSYGGAFALALHQIARRAAADGLDDALTRYENEALLAPPSPPVAPPSALLEIRAAVAELDLHLREHAADAAQQLLDGTLGNEVDDEASRAARVIAGGPDDAVEIGHVRKRSGSLVEHRRRPRWAAAVRTVGKSDVEKELAFDDDLTKVMNVAIAARETIAPGCTVDIYRRTMLAWLLTDTLPALTDPNRIHGGTGGELIRDGAAVLGCVEPRGTGWTAKLAGAAPGQFLEPGTHWGTHAAAADAVRRSEGRQNGE